ncbi:MAG: UPF0104 family protein [Candidatus Neomarinimicrobiota bacterium]|nr:MAG: UPF0104 family protein [Candidatus Neomarinimicrobiota bacterium]
MIKLIFGIGISVIGLLFAFRQLDVSALLTYLTAVNLPLVSSASLLMIYSVWVRAQRWKLLLNRPAVRTHRLFASAMVGYFGNSVLPFRLGEALRAYDITTKESVQLDESVSTIILERILDLVGFILVIALFTALYPFSMAMNRSAWLVIGLILIVFVFVVWIPGPFLRVQRLLKRWESPHPWLQRINTFVQGLIDGLLTLRNNPNRLGLSFHTVYLWGIYYGSLWLITRGVGIHLSWVQIGVLLMSTTFSIMIPAAPGYVGTYHAVAVLVLNSMFSIPLSQSQAVAILLHAIGTLPYVVLGAMYFIQSSVRISDLNRGSGV